MILSLFGLVNIELRLPRTTMTNANVIVRVKVTCNIQRAQSHIKKNNKMHEKQKKQI